MHPLARKHLKKVLEGKEKRLVGADEECEYYPCHFAGQDCTWCFCPFYPCEDEQTGGKWTRRKAKDGGRVWDCSNCYWIHEPEVAEGLLEMFKERGVESVERLEEEEGVAGGELRELFLALKERFPPAPGKR